MKTLSEIKLQMLAIVLIIIGGINWGSIGLFGKNLLEELNNWTFKNKWVIRSIYILVGIAAIYLIFKRDTFLPFLGETILPIKQYKYYTNDSNTSIRINATGASGVIYWAAEPGKLTSNPQDAYNQYTNSGYVPVNPDGTAILYFNCPRQYQVMGGLKTLPKHVHYRLVYGHGTDTGLNISQVFTININC